MALDQRRGAGIIALDCETTGLDPLRDTIRLIQLATPDHPVLIVDCQTLSAAGWDALRTFLASPMRKLFHHAKFDVAMLRAAGVAVEGPYADTMLAAQLLRGDRSKQEGPFTLAALVRDYLGEDLSKAQQASDWTGTLTPAQLAYAAKDACILLRLWEAMVPDLEAAQLTAVAELEFAALPALVEIELAGMKVDRAALTALQQTLADARDAAVTAARAALEAPTLNLQSPPQLLRVLQRRGIPVDGTGKDVLRPLAAVHPELRPLLHYKAIHSLQQCVATVTKHVNLDRGASTPSVISLVRRPADYRSATQVCRTSLATPKSGAALSLNRGLCS